MLGEGVLRTVDLVGDCPASEPATEAMSVAVIADDMASLEQRSRGVREPLHRTSDLEERSTHSGALEALGAIWLVNGSFGPSSNVSATACCDGSPW